MKQRLSVIILFFISTFQINSQGAISIGVDAPDIIITDWISNVPVDKNLKGKYLILDFWATWCVPCIQGMDHINELKNRFSKRKDIYFLSITDEEPSKVKKLLEIKTFNTIVVSDQTKKTQINFGDGKRGIEVLPLAVLIDKNWKIRWIGVPKYLTIDLIEKFVSNSLVSKGVEIDQKHLDSEQNNLSSGQDYLAKIIKLGQDKETHQYLMIKEANGEAKTDFRVAKRLFYVRSLNVKEIMKFVFGYNENVIVVENNNELKMYDIIHKNDNLDSIGVISLEKKILDTLGFEKVDDWAFVRAKIITKNDKWSLKKSNSKKKSVAKVDDKIIFSSYSSIELAEEINKRSDFYYIVNFEDNDVYDFVINFESEDKILSSLKSCGFTIEEKEEKTKIYKIVEKWKN